MPLKFWCSYFRSVKISNAVKSIASMKEEPPTPRVRDASNAVAAEEPSTPRVRDASNTAVAAAAAAAAAASSDTEDERDEVEALFDPSDLEDLEKYNKDMQSRREQTREQLANKKQGMF